MEIGGAERALLGLLDSIDYRNYDVDLLLCQHSGEFMPMINRHVKILPYDKRYDCFISPITSLIKRGQLLVAAIRLWARYVERIHSKRRGVNHNVWHTQQIIHNTMRPLLPTVTGHYDLAINFLGVPSILAFKVDAKVKMTWIHTDYDRIVANASIDRKMFDPIDYIVNVSDDCKRIFDNHYPDYKARSIVIENILNTSLVRKLAAEYTELPYEPGYVNLLSIGRFSEPKNFDSIPEMCRIMLDNGVAPFKWYIIGYGQSEQQIRDNLVKFKVENVVQIIGKRSNPYPYIYACDVYVQPSRYEGKAVTVREAQMLGKPVIVTAYNTASSQINNGVDGLILPMDTISFATALTQVLADHTRLDSLASYCSAHDFSNESEIQKIYSRFDVSTATSNL